MTKVRLSEEFSLYPMGRSDEDGADNGRRFFDEFLRPSIEAGNKITVVFDGVRAFGSSFLDEAFHEMPAKNGIDVDRFKELVSIEATGRAYSFYKTMTEKFMDKIPKVRAK